MSIFAQKLFQFIGRNSQIRTSEIPAISAAFSLFFFVLGGYFAVRPIRETIGSILGSERISELWILTSLGAIAIVPIYGWIIARIRRSIVLPAIYTAVVLGLTAFGFLFRTVSDSSIAYATFYVSISILNLMLVSIFWSFLLELFSSEQALRLFGVIAAGGTLGALVGPIVTDLTVKKIGISGVLFIGALMFVGAIICQRLLISVWKSSSSNGNSSNKENPIGGNPFAGIKIVLQSPYLLMISVFVVLLSAANTFLYFQQLDIVTTAFPDPQQRTQVFARIDFIVQALTVISQLFITGKIAQKFGITTLLSIVPLAVMIGFLLLASTGSFVVLASVLIIRRWGEYAFIRPGREMLFSVLDKEAKYKGKNMIDVPVYRGADALVAQLQNLLKHAGINATGIAFIGAGAALVWATIGYWLGREYKKKTAI